MKLLIGELNGLLALSKPHHLALEALDGANEKISYIAQFLSREALSSFQTLPQKIQAQLLIGRDAHGNVQVSKIETERMMIELVEQELKRRAKTGGYQGVFNAVPIFCGYEGRSCLPSNFDSNYCYALGYVAALLVYAKANGYMCRLGNLAKPVAEWEPGGVPLTTLMTMEERDGKIKAVIEKALVDLSGRPFSTFAAQRTRWADDDDYVNPGPIQFFGPAAIADAVTMTLALSRE